MQNPNLAVGAVTTDQNPQYLVICGIYLLAGRKQIEQIQYRLRKVVT